MKGTISEIKWYHKHFIQKVHELKICDFKGKKNLENKYFCENLKYNVYHEEGCDLYVVATYLHINIEVSHHQYQGVDYTVNSIFLLNRLLFLTKLQAFNGSLSSWCIIH